METSTSGRSGNNGGSGEAVVKSQRTVRIENPFSLKVGQVFTGVGIGCGIGIGVGRPLNLGAIPVLNEVMSAARGATYAFSGVQGHVNNSLRKLGAKNIDAGIGCGVGFGHGFGIGLAVKPGVVDQIRSCLMQSITHVMTKLGVAPNLSVGQGLISAPLQSGNVKELSYSSLDSSGSKSRDANSRNISSQEILASESSAIAYSSRTEEVLSKFLENPLLKDEDGEPNQLVPRLKTENNLLRMVLRHQQIIEELRQENEKLHQILVEDLKISPDKLQTRYSIRSKSPCTECFECRRKQRRR